MYSYMLNSFHRSFLVVNYKEISKIMNEKSILDYNKVNSTRTIVFFGKCGVGKTSLLNRLFNMNWATDNAVACTKKLTFKTYSPLEFSPIQKIPLRIVDTPGMGESEHADKIYFPHYVKTLSKVQQIIWVFQADTRDYKTDQEMIHKLCHYIRGDAEFVIALNQVDNIPPSLDWNLESNTPSETQQIYIAERKADVIDHFEKVLPCPINAVVPCSARYGYGTNGLISLIINAKEKL